MPKPTLVNEWSSNTNLSAGPYAGVRPTKVTPTSGQIADGIVPGTSFKGQFVNWFMNHLWDWASWLNDGSSADGADAHVVETDSAGEINVVGVNVGGVDLADALGVYGDGSDGDATISASTTTLSRSMYYNDLTLSSVGILDANGHIVHVKGTLTIDATSIMHWDGGDGAAGAAGVGGAGGTSGLSGAPLGAGYAGGAGGNDSTAGSSGTTGGDTIAPVIGGDGGASVDRAGGNASATTAAAAADGALRGLMCATTGHALGAGAVTQVRGGGGGGGGGGSTTNAAGGGGGCGGNVGVLCARRIVVAGQIRANGGNGGDGENDMPLGHGGGSGGGGSGGMLYIVTRGIDNPENCVALGGSAGTPGTGAISGLPGVDGGDGVVVFVYA